MHINITDMKIRTKITLLSLGIVAVSVFTITAICLTIFRGEIMRQVNEAQDAGIKIFWDLLKEGGSQFRIVDGKLLAGGYVLNENNELVDKMSSLTGGAATIFMGDVRIATSVVKPEGGRATGTKLTGPAYEALFKEKKAYRGQADILGEAYMTAYDPIKNAKGETIGVLFVGMKKVKYFSSFNQMMIIIILCAVLLFGVVGMVAFVFTRRAFAPLNKMVAVADELASGNLSHDVPKFGNDEIGDMARSFNKMISNLRRIVGHVKIATVTVASDSGLLSATSDDLNRSSEELRSQIDQIVTSMTEVSQTIMDMAKNASQAADASKNASDTAAKGKKIVDTTAADMVKIAQTVQEAAGTIEELGKSSAQIGEIVTVINSIADQTNLLALNAAIEAARAGEQGRGFAVVADEVRKLAERTSQATKDITQRIAAIQSAAGESVDAMKRGSDEVDKGVGLAKEASASLDTIVTASNNAMDMVQRIAAATEQQSAATEEVTQSMESISSITKQFSGATGKIKVSSGELAKLAVGLREMSAFFKGTTVEAEELVKKAINHIQTNGREKAFADISDKDGEFVNRDLYVMVYDMNGRCLAHGRDREMVGQDMINLLDPDNKPIVRERVEIARTKGKGWQDYKTLNPATKKIEEKTAYNERYEDIIVGSGAFK